MPLEGRRRRILWSLHLRRNWFPLATVVAVILFIYLLSSDSRNGNKSRSQYGSQSPNSQHYGWNEFIKEDSHQELDLDLDNLGSDDLFPTKHGRLALDEELFLGDPPANQHSYKWDVVEDVPETIVFAHVPGHTVLHNVYSLNGVFYLVSEHRRSVPPLKYVLSSWAELPDGRVLVNPPTDSNIRVINKVTATRLFGKSARIVRGTTWWNNDPLPYVDDSTILHFARTHHMQSHRLHFNMSLLPPDRIFYPRISDRIQTFAAMMSQSSSFTPDKPDLLAVIQASAIPGISFIPGLASLPGLASIPRLLFPGIGVGFEEDWNDYSFSGRPVLFEALTLIDSAAAVRNPKLRPKSGADTSTAIEYLDADGEAERARARLETGSPLGPFRILDNVWWGFWRDKMADIIGTGIDPERSASSGHLNAGNLHGGKNIAPVTAIPVITYISRQGEILGRLQDSDHESLVAELQRLGDRYGYEIHIISPSRLTYVERVAIALRSTVILGPTGPGLMDIMWMQPSSSALLVEIFPKDYLSSRQYTVARTVGIQYLAWRGSRSFVPSASLHADNAKRDSNIHARMVQDTSAWTASLMEPIRLDALALCNELVERLEVNHGHDDEDM